MKCSFIDCSNELNKGNKYCSLSCSNKDRTYTTKYTDLVQCLRPECGIEFVVTYKTARQKFCSRSCAALTNNTKKLVLCLRCGVPCGTGKSYCSKACKKLLPVEQWLAGHRSAKTKYGLASWARQYVLEQASFTCEAIDLRTNLRCTENRSKLDGKTVLQIDHIDGNWQNCNRSNLRALCPTCHALTETYGASNMGYGRTWKRNYNQFVSKRIK